MEKSAFEAGNMVPFAQLFPEIAAHETRCITHPDIPMGKLGFLESYCAGPGCDCRRVFLNVVPESRPARVLAAIGFGWENFEFYRNWSGGGSDGIETASVLKGPDLEPGQSRSEHSDALLKLFKEYLIADERHVARLVKKAAKSLARELGRRDFFGGI